MSKMKHVNYVRRLFMAHSIEWLPSRRVQQLTMARRWYEILQTKAIVWNIPAREVTELESLIITAADCLRIVQSTERSMVNTAQCKAAFNALIAKMRFLKKHYFLSPPLTDADLISLGLKPHDKTWTSIPTPVNQPGLEVVKWAPHTLGLRYFTAIDMGDVEASYGIRVYYGLVAPGASAAVDGKVSASRLAGDVYTLSSRPATEEALPNSFFTRRKKYILVLPLEASGYTCYLAARFENGKGHEGPWGTMIQALVP
jgi:hypothetical protein